jgi:hypothetical protein
MSIFTRSKANHKNISISAIPLVHNVVQNKVNSDDNTASVLDCVAENLSEAESSE